MQEDRLRRGWSKRWIAEQLGKGQALQFDEKQVEVKNFVALRHLWKRTPGCRVAANGHEQTSITRACNYGEALAERCRQQRAKRARKNRKPVNGVRSGRGSRGVAA